MVTLFTRTAIQHTNEFTLKTVFLNNLAQIDQCTKVYFILSTEEKRTHFTSKVLLTQFKQGSEL